MTTIDDRLRSLGDALDLGDDGLVDRVMARLDEPAAATPPSASFPVLRVAAALVVVLAVVVAAVPSSRRAVADWFGFDGVRIEQRPSGSVPDDPDPFERGSVGSVVELDGTEVLVSEFVGTLDNPAIAKTVTGETSIRQVEVGGELAIWVDGAPHEVSFLDERGEIVFQGFAGNTLLWQDGPVIRRVEGFGDVAAAVAYAEAFGT